MVLEPVVLPPPSEPMQVANRLVAEHHTEGKNGLLLRHWRGEFWQWKRTHWRDLPETTLRAEAYRFTENAVYMRMDRNGAEIEEPWAPNRRKIGDLIDALRAIAHLPSAIEMPGWLDEADHPAPAELVAATNGLLHVPTRTLFEHDHRYFNRVAVPFDYRTDAAPPTRWLEFLDQLWPDDPESIAALAEFMGYVISGRIDLHKILLLIGPTRAGKGVIARVFKALVGRGNCAGPTLSSLGTNFGLSPLIGRPLAIVSDARLGGNTNVHQVVERLLSISGEDMLTIDIKYREPWTGTLPTRFLVISNELPRFGDASGAIANRFLVLTLTQSWLGHENSGLTDELLTELPGIFGWVLDGLDRLLARGRFAEPASSRDAVLTLADLVSPVSAFVRERCLPGPGFKVACDALFAEWRGWAEDNGHRPGSVQTLARDLRAVVPSLRTIRPREGEERHRWFDGIGLRTDDNMADRGPVRTALELFDHAVAPVVVVRDGPRPARMSTGLIDQTDPELGDRIECADFRGHQLAHRRLISGWICDICSSDNARSGAPGPAGRLDDWGTV